MSFSLYAVVCKGILEEKSPGSASRAGRDALGNPRAAWALELRSRRALSSQVRRQN